MASFSDKDYNSDNYSSFRPTYSAALAQAIVDYHTQCPGNQLKLAVDLATGTGQMCAILSPHFERVYGLDISATMLEAATPWPNVTYALSSAEGPSWDSRIAPGSVDVVTVGEGAHWFRRPAVWDQIRRMLKSNGTLAIFGYSFICFPNKPRATQQLWDLGRNPAKYGALWDAGRKSVDILYGDWEIPFSDVQRLYSSSALVKHSSQTQRDGPAPASTTTALPSEITQVLQEAQTANGAYLAAPDTYMHRDMSPNQLEAYLNTWSAGKKYIQCNPEHTTLIRDTVQQMMDSENCQDQNQIWPVEWNTVLILGRNPSSSLQ
ncbi:trans-aconitate methyltransferase 1 [Dimargaris cristalligena]|nr:trans-aconitate methyltransferase 1 [Dimargaris cristalligena]